VIIIAVHPLGAFPFSLIEKYLGGEQKLATRPGDLITMPQKSEPMVSDVLKGKDGRIISTKSNILATQAANLMATERVGIIIVVDDEGKFCGILSERDIVRAFGRFGAKAAQVSVGDITTRKVIGCVTETPLARVQNLMKDGGFRHMPVVEDGRVKGIISIGDILGFLAERDHQAAA